MKILFNVMGACEQEIQLAEDCPLSEEEVVASLNGETSHCVMTSVQEFGDLIMLKDGEEIILGEIVSSDMDADYSEFVAVKEG